MFKSVKFWALTALALTFLVIPTSTILAQSEERDEPPAIVNRVYYIADLGVSPEHDLNDTSSSNPAAGGFGGGAFGGGFGGQGGGFGGGGGKQQTPMPLSGGSGCTNVDYVNIINLIQSTVYPDFWEVGNGNSSIYPFRGTIIVRAPEQVHDELKKLLTDLRQYIGDRKSLQIHWIAIVATSAEQEMLKKQKGIPFENTLDELAVNSGMFSVSNGKKGTTTAGEYRNFNSSVTPVVGGGGSFQVQQQNGSPTVIQGNQVGYRPEITSTLFGWRSTVLAVTDKDRKNANLNFQITYTEQIPTTPTSTLGGVKLEKSDMKKIEVNGQTKSAPGQWNCVGAVEAGEFFEKADDENGTQKKKLMVFVKWE